MATSRFPKLFSEAKVGGMTLKNRIVLAPMVRNYAEVNGRSTPRHEAHVERIARGGAAMLVLEASYVSPEGKGFTHELGLHDDAVIPGLKKLVAAAHAHGAVIGPQLYHAGRQTSPVTTGLAPVAPSPIPDPTVGALPVPMDIAMIHSTVEAFARAAGRAKAAGCDFVEIHGAHGYLVTQFLSPFSNRRIDSYGGSLENRMRFLLEVYAAVRKEVGSEFPITLRLSGDEMVAGGLTIKDTVAVAKRMEKEGIAAIHVSAGNYASYARGRMIPPMAVPDAPLENLAAAVKKSVSVPVIAVAKIRDPKTAERILKDGHADLIAFGRPLLADPDMPRKAMEGKADTIMPCIACNQGCISRLFAQQDVWCTVNPETGREATFAVPAKKKLVIAVVGGGPGGMSAAKTAAQRGHKVILYEKSARLGGQLFAAEKAPHRDGWRELRLALVRDVKAAGVDVRLKTPFTAEAAIKDKIDGVIIAVGSSPVRPHIPGIWRSNVVVAVDLLEGRAKAKGDVIVVGGGCSGAQTAEHLAVNGHKVTVIEAGGSIAADAPVDDRALLLGRLEKRGVKTVLETRLMDITERGVSVDGPRGPKVMPADTVVMCLGATANDPTAAEIAVRGKSFVVVGDAKQPRRVTDAVAEGALAVFQIEKENA